MVKIVVGSGRKRLPGYTHVDLNPEVEPDYVTSADILDFCGDGEAEEILLEAVYEHLYESERMRALEEWARVLKKGGALRILWVPDTEIALSAYYLHLAEIEVAGVCNRKECGPVPEFPHFDLEMLERVTSGAKGLHDEKPYQVHKSIFNRAKVRDEVSKFGQFDIQYCSNQRYPGEVGVPYNICLSAVRK